MANYDDPAVFYDSGIFYDDGPLSGTQQQKPKNKKKNMKRQNWYPSRMGDQTPWLENFRTKLAVHATTLALDAAKVTSVTADTRYIIYVLNQWLPAARTLSPSSTETIDILLDGTGASAMVLPTFTAPALPTGVVSVLPGALTRVFDIIGEIKESDTYTDAIGQDLGIIGAEDTATHASPTIKINVDAGDACQCVKIGFVKHGHMGVHIESRRNGGAWEFLGIDTESPYQDERPLLVAGTPEIREYRARFWDKGTANGEWTDVAKTTVAP